ncbi:MAG: bifunctional (p)ppGpp synthetase/guanosine-3',5'-bis(diphosphate) 3'-pyrophosphohydrolase, partial [Dehalococcoidia bacterium]|nr:bifunctional (p)ppGpp synthetase/guanosine-3',5'-bis(diphosphate) 3'-pyrophosphohydrolase [Dehalococcoidia bacterium]
WFKKQHRSENIERGRESLERELKRLGMSLPQWQDELLRLFKFEVLDDFLATVGHGEVSAQQVAIRAANLQRQRELEAEAVEDPLRPSAPKAPRVASVQVLGAGDVLTSLGRCCNPLPGDAIIGYVTRLRGVSVHRADCSNVLHTSEPERLLQVEWGRDGNFYPVSVRLEAWDRVGLLRDISNIVAEEKINMVGVRTQEHADRTTSVLLTLETTGIEQLTRVLNKLEGVRGTLSVSRWSEGA